MKSQERWDFAQTYGARQLIKLGYFFCILSLLGILILSFISISVPISLIVFVITILSFCIILIIKVERAIKRKFSTKSDYRSQR